LRQPAASDDACFGKAKSSLRSIFTSFTPGIDATDKGDDMRELSGRAGVALIRGVLSIVLLVAAVHREAVANESVEAEQLVQKGKARASGGELHVQPMAGFGPGWSGDAQLFWTAPGAGAVLDLELQLPKNSRWTLELEMTAAPDYGKVELELDGNVIGLELEIPPPPGEEKGFRWTTLPRTWNGYSSKVEKGSADSRETLRPPQVLDGGEHRLRIKVIGKDERSTGYYVGVDRLVFHRVPPRPVN
jgi:hypothetical protein